MALIRLTENRYIDTSRIAEIEYTPPSLHILLSTGQELRFEGAKADNVWSAFQAAQQADLAMLTGNKDYGAIHVKDGLVSTVETSAEAGTSEAEQFEGLKNSTIVQALNKLAALHYAPLQGAVEHRQGIGGTSYTMFITKTPPIPVLIKRA